MTSCGRRPRKTSKPGGRRAAGHVREELGAQSVSERRVCKVLGQARSTQRREPYVPDDEPLLTKRIIDLATQYGPYGYRRIRALLRREALGGEWIYKIF